MHVRAIITCQERSLTYNWACLSSAWGEDVKVSRRSENPAKMIAKAAASHNEEGSEDQTTRLVGFRLDAARHTERDMPRHVLCCACEFEAESHPRIFLRLLPLVSHIDIYRCPTLSIAMSFHLEISHKGFLELGKYRRVST